MASRNRLPALAVGGMALVAAAFFALNALARWRNFETNAFDLGFFDQIIYNTLHGRPGQTSFISYNFFGQHFEPILAVFLLPYALGATPLFLTITQSVVAASAAIPLYGAARRWGAPVLLALPLSASYLLNPYLHRAVNFDFHPEVVVALPAFAGAWAMAAGRSKLAVGLALSTLLFKEDAVFVALALAALMWSRGMRPEAKRVAFVSLAWAAIVMFVVLPLARHGEPSDLVQRYGHLVETTNQSAFIPRLLLHPWVIPQALLAPARLWTAALFIGVSAPLAIPRPKFLLLLVPGLALALLAEHGAQTELELHYSANVLAVAFLVALPAVGAWSAIRGSALARAAPPGTSGYSVITTLRPFVVAGLAVAAFLWMSPFSPFADTQRAPTAEHRAAVLAALALIPGDDQVRVSAQSGLLPRLSQRDNIHEFPARALDADWVIVDRYGHKSSQSIADGYDSRLEILRIVDERVFDRDGVEVFRRRQ